jgi:putative phosphoribosyl transferase
VNIPWGLRGLNGMLCVPKQAQGIVLFVDGSGRRFNPRNQFVASVLQAQGLATLLLDVLVPGEAGDGQQPFDIACLARRLQQAAAWLSREPETETLPLGLLGAGTGAAAALAFAARQPDRVAAVVSCGGWPHLVMESLPAVQAPTLLIIGENDDDGFVLNERALRRLRCCARLVVIPGATHLFAGPALGEVACLARGWFNRHLAPARGPAGL